MVRILFHHRSPLIGIVEFLGVLGLAAMPWRMAFEASGSGAWILLALVAAEYAFIRYCASRCWYRNAPRYAGIELQFKKALSPTVYIMLIGGLLFQLFPSWFVLLIVALLLAVISHVNVILIILHRRDPANDPVNVLSRPVTRDT